MNYERLEPDKKDILLIDDMADNLRVLSSLLTREGYNVRKALNWQMALTACQTVLPDLILLDIMMPEVDGYEVCQRLKAWDMTTNIPVIFISALDDVFDKIKAFQVGGVDYITKPFELQEVLVRVQNQLALRSAQLEIIKLNIELEERVKQRTWELENALHKLQDEVTSRQQLQSKLLDLALHDSLTGLANRVLFIRRVEKALNRAKQNSDYQFALLYLDCDRFKVVNDSLGHLVGDELLLAIAHRLKISLRENDTLARLGGDEFGILLEDPTNMNMVLEVAENILQQLSLPFKLTRYEVFMNASIGIAWGNKEYDIPEYLLRDADTAMYRAKALGRARYHVFDPIMYQEAIQLLELENDLRRAVARQEFIVYYQPIVSLYTGKIAGFEALVRWKHPQRGLIPPSDFIPVAEETGLISDINTWVLQSACQQLHLWENHPEITQPITMSVNLSARMFSQPNLIAQIDEILYETKVNPENLELEITESVIMENIHAVKTILQQLQERRIKLVMDDFGTGYSSLSYLHSFPLSALKIDKSFVKRMQENQEDMGLVPAMIGIADSMGMRTIAEGVETREQLDQLRSLNCEFAQGFLFSQPIEQQSVIHLLTKAPQW
ncbi:MULTISPECIES: two-component system response regulator [unclassified Tolypothrix]|uniref:two-component system response regulator n=1 Tax=unclassified Tolypothrix TaxID=2649714 RepID=UPI0005EABBAB|nr:MULTISPECIES: GGDEF domain-containing response regulator [unclassified Tolypothrix]BAY89994.1 response regulator receiver modulated diguanylate cyclase/phosphodiesterase [Microchaete diplosiphon NIES-3275]EKE98773.1 response regulator [Tolypothrix sp. PCC 7601]MBE9084907.1 EAL domain-containing protein [Tolypothrix sp. LEGE 11397]UYD24222.1 EAL domain-containing protein [Tolypothrix sp. PCC 7712]UYD33549.1 EAL domain-containing protein [Tolypothrix sp. PCC 7601]